MSEPRKALCPTETPVDAAISELLSAGSALNMEPDPIVDRDTGPYLADQDKWAAHACEHITAAIEILSGCMG